MANDSENPLTKDAMEEITEKTIDETTEEAAAITKKQRVVQWLVARFKKSIQLPSRGNQAALVVFFAALNMEMALTIPGIPTGLGIWADYFIIGSLYLLISLSVIVALYITLSFFYMRAVAGWIAGASFIIVQSSMILHKSNWGWKATTIMTSLIVLILLGLTLLISYMYAYKRKSMNSIVMSVAAMLCIVIVGISIKSYWNEAQRNAYIEQYSTILLQDQGTEDSTSDQKDGADSDDAVPVFNQDDSTADAGTETEGMKLKTNPMNLADPGTYSYRHLYYNSDQAYLEDENDHTLYVSPMDGSTVLKDWSWTKELFWGFTEHEIAIKGQLWVPEGEGPFPVVFIMHGNHLSEEDSSDGYAYLGELLASHGMIVSSINANFLNYSVWSGIVDDDQMLRSWLMLSHISKLKEQQLNADWDNVALIGHSRGGQAAAMAVDAKKWFPNEEVVTILDEVDVKAVIAIAPTDYRVDGKFAYLKDVNYLTLHGTMDSDLTESFGERQYERTTFTTDSHFKATVELYHANHGQFNTVWGKYDEQFPGALALNTADLMSGEDQRLAAQLFIHSFLGASFSNNPSYEAVFQDFRVIGEQLPLTGYVSRYDSGNTKYWFDFERPVEAEESLDMSEELIAKSIDLKGRSGGDKQNRVLWVTWNKRDSELVFPVRNVNRASKDTVIDAIVVSLARAERMADPEEDEEGNAENDASQTSDAQLHNQVQDSEVSYDANAQDEELQQLIKEFEQDAEDEAYTGLRLKLKLNAKQWGEESIDLEPHYHILHPATHDFTKVNWLEENIKKGKYDVAVEPLLQTYVIPISLIEQYNPRDGDLFVSDLDAITFIFKDEMGSMIIDTLGYITEGGHYVEYSR